MTWLVGFAWHTHLYLRNLLTGVHAKDPILVGYCVKDGNGTMKAIVVNHSSVLAKAIWVPKHVQRKYLVKTCLYQTLGEYLELMTKVQ
jgi:N-acetylglutamate synthase/N-acetylornithine aminotransferase